MKKKELEALKEKTKKELLKLVEEKKNESLNLISKMHAGKEKNLKKSKILRRDIAQILTLAGKIGEEKWKYLQET